MKNIDHPSKFIDGEMIDRIRASAFEAENLWRLHPDQLSVIHGQRWFKMFVPEDHGGLGLSIPEGVKIEEALSWADGSTGWVVTLCSGAGWFAGFLHPDLLKEVFSDDRLCVAGSGAPTGSASIVENGYEVRGYWRYASGSIHATVFTANCVIIKNGVPVLQNDGTPSIRAFLLKKNEVSLHQKWNGMGMVATGSHDFEVKPIRLPENRCFRIDPEHAVLPQALYRYPFQQFAEATLAVNLSGMAVRFLDLCDVIFHARINRKNYPEAKGRTLSQTMTDALESLHQSRQLFYDQLDNSWSFCAAGKIIPQELLQKVSESSLGLASVSRRVVDELYPYCGLIAANTGEEINRVWRNLHTASQHAAFGYR